MATQSTNEGFHVLEDFVCEAIHSSSIPQVKRTRGGVSEEVSLIVDGDVERIRCAVEQLANLISNSADPKGAMAYCRELLVAQVGKTQKGDDSAK